MSKSSPHAVLLILIACLPFSTSYADQVNTDDEEIKFDNISSFHKRDIAYNFAKKSYESGNYTKAIEIFNRILSEHSNHSRSWRALARSLEKMRNSEMALVAIDRAIKLEPGKSANYQIRGQCLSNLERYDEAILSFEQARILDGFDVWYLPYMVRAYRKIGELEKGRNIAQVAKSSSSNHRQSVGHSAWLYRESGRVLYELGFADKALKDFITANELEPGLEYVEDFIQKLQGTPE